MVKQLFIETEKKMKKAYPFNILSNKRCVKCDRRLKMNVVERKSNVDLCYNCNREEEEARGNSISTAKEVRQGKRPKRKKMLITAIS